MAFTAIVMVFSPPEYCKLFAQKETYQGEVVTGTPGPPPPSPSYALRVLVLKSGIRILENRLLHPPLRISMSTPFPSPPGIRGNSHSPLWSQHHRCGRFLVQKQQSSSFFDKRTFHNSSSLFLFSFPG